MASSGSSENVVKSESSIVVKQKASDSGILVRADFCGGPVSLDEIEKGLYLGNLTAATNMETLRSFNITCILTLDSVPLPKHITEAFFPNTKYIQMFDMPKEDILHHLNTCVEFITLALGRGDHILVHCYFGVSRSSSAVIAYIMKRYNMEYQQAYDYVKSKRRYVQPNVGFIAQLKLWRLMGCNIDPQCQKYKMYHLRLAGEQVRKAKILPQNFNHLIKSDPAITQENPEPIVYRCRKCRRVVASKSHLLLHTPKNQAVTKSSIPNESNILPTHALMEEISARIRYQSISTSDGQQPQLDADKMTFCQSILFVEPIAWMQHITNNTQGRLNCPKCDQKLGNYSWINGCQCPCGEEFSPAFYLIPSKVELSKTVQNVQTTL